MPASETSIKIMQLHFEKRLTDEEIAAELKLTPQHVKSVLAWYRHHPEAVNNLPAIVEESKEEPEMKRKETTDRILEMYRGGVPTRDIMVGLGVNKAAVRNAVTRARARGEIVERPAKPTEAGIPAETPQPVPSMPKPAPMPEQPEPRHDAPQAFDLTAMHILIDIAAQLPSLKALVLASCDEMEKTAQYQLYQVKRIREALTA